MEESWGELDMRGKFSWICGLVLLRGSGEWCLDELACGGRWHKSQRYGEKRAKFAWKKLERVVRLGWRIFYGGQVHCTGGLKLQKRRAGPPQSI